MNNKISFFSTAKQQLRLYKTARAAKIAKAQYTRFNRRTSNVFVHNVQDKRAKQKTQYALIVLK